MEKISALIDKLQELKNSEAGLQTISYYTQLLQAEILHQRNLQKQQELKGHGHVAVILPAHTPAPVVEKVVPPPPQEIPEKVMQNGYAQDRVPMKSRPQEQAATLFDPPPSDPPSQRQQPETAVPKVEEPVNRSNHLQANPPQPEEVVNNGNHLHTHGPEEPANDGNYLHTNPPDEMANSGNHWHTNPPQQQEAPANKGNHLHTNPSNIPPHNNSPESPNGIRKELNELISRNTTSLNDALRANGKVELGERLGGLGVKDLKDAIGINDKFQFIQELFRSDKTMYDRSIKTINESMSLQEAENWIERELKIKLGWNENDPLVKQFYSLVRKRFS